MEKEKDRYYSFALSLLGWFGDGDGDGDGTCDSVWSSCLRG